MNESVKNPFDAMLDAFRQIVRDELKAGGNGNGHAAGDDEHARTLASAKMAVAAGALLTAEQLAAMLQVHKATVYERVKRKTIPYHQAGRFVRFDFHEVLESQRKKNSNPS
jgi:excisionase family DNA binding protein